MSRGEPSNLSVRKVVTASAPAAGAEAVTVVPIGHWWELVDIRFNLTTSAVAGNRRVALAIDDGTTEFWRWRSGADQAAGQTRLYQFLISLNNEVDRSATFAELYEPLDEGLILTPGSRIRTVTAGIDAGDAYSAPVFYIVEYG